MRNTWEPSLDEMRDLRQRCDVQAWFKFVRVPYWQNGIFNDLRFALRSKENFTTLDTSLPPVCPPLPAPWGAPRQDLLNFLNELASLNL